MFCREIDSEYSTPPGFSLRVLYGSHPRFHGFKLPERNFKSEADLDSESRMAMVISVSRNHSRVAIHLAIVNPARMPPITIIRSLVMIKFANIMAEFTMNSSQLMMSVVMMMVVMLFCVSSRWSNQH